MGDAYLYRGCCARFSYGDAAVSGQITPSLLGNTLVSARLVPLVEGTKLGGFTELKVGVGTRLSDGLPAEVNGDGPGGGNGGRTPGGL